MRIAAVLLSLLVSAGTEASGQALKDQFGAETDIGSLGSRGAIVLWSDKREAGELLEAWGEALREALKAAGVPAAKVIAVSDLRALPFFVPRGAVVGVLKKDYPDRPILLDWKGELRAKWGLGDPGVAALVVGASGELRARAAGPASRAEAARLAAAYAR